MSPDIRRFRVEVTFQAQKAGLIAWYETVGGYNPSEHFRPKNILDDIQSAYTKNETFLLGCTDSHNVQYILPFSIPLSH